jgi:transcription termination factor Rho
LVTILAPVKIDTGSRMDQFIYEEFKGTGTARLCLTACWPRLMFLGAQSIGQQHL